MKNRKCNYPPCGVTYSLDYWGVEYENKCPICKVVNFLRELQNKTLGKYLDRRAWQMVGRCPSLIEQQRIRQQQLGSGSRLGLGLGPAGGLLGGAAAALGNKRLY